MEKDKYQELEKILSELNSNISRQEDPGETPPDQAAPGEAGRETAAPAEPPPPARKGRKRQHRQERAERPERSETPQPEERRRSFAESARIIEDSLEDRELRQPAVRHIAVTSAEVVEEPPPPPRRRRAYDQQKPLPQEEAIPPMPKRRRKQMSRRERTTAVLGVIVTLFFVIGVISSVAAGISLTRNLVNATAQKEELARVIFPLVIVDIPEFDSPEALENSAIIQSAIWAFIIDSGDKSKYPKDDLGAMTVPDTDIEPYIRSLYGNDVQIEHQSIDDPSVQMLYDSDNKRYIIESTPRFLAYTPRVEKISRSGDVYTLRVSYVLPDALWNLEKDHSSATVDKIMEYTLKRNRDAYQMLSVRLLEVTGRSEQGADTAPTPAIDDEGWANEEELPVSSGESLSLGTASAPEEDAGPEEEKDAGSEGAASSEADAASGESASDEESSSEAGEEE